MNALRLGAAIGLSAMTLGGCGFGSSIPVSSQPSADSSSSADPEASSTSSSPPASDSGSSTRPPTRKPTDSGGGRTAGSGSGGGTGGSQGAVSLPLTASVREAVKDAYFTAALKDHPDETWRHVDGPNDADYGKVNGVYYVAGEIGFSDDDLSKQGGPHVWRSTNGSTWAYLGDTGGNVCVGVPRALVSVWGRSCL